jgi:hypothetical protein
VLAPKAGESDTFSGAWPIADILAAAAPVGLATAPTTQTLACAILVAGSEAAYADSHGMPLYPALLVPVAVPAPSLDPAGVTAQTASASKVAIMATFDGVPSTYTVALAGPDGTEFRTELERDGEDGSMCTAQLLVNPAALGTAAGGSALVSWVVRDQKGLEVLRTPQAPLALGSAVPSASGFPAGLTTGLPAGFASGLPSGITGGAVTGLPAGMPDLSSLMGAAGASGADGGSGDSGLSGGGSGTGDGSDGGGDLEQMLSQLFSQFGDGVPGADGALPAAGK